MNCELPDVQAGFRKGRGTRDQIANICWIIEKAREYQKNIYFCFINYTKVFVWITTNCGKFFKRWEYQTTWPDSWEICMQVKKQHLELGMEQQTGSKSGKKYIKAVYCHPVYLTYMQNTSLEKAMASHSNTLAWKIPWTEEPGRLQSTGSLGVRHDWPTDFTFTFHFHALEKEMATHSSVLAWRIPGTGEPSGLPSMGSHRVRHDWGDVAVAAVAAEYIMRNAGLDEAQAGLKLLGDISITSDMQMTPLLWQKAKN